MSTPLVLAAIALTFFCVDITTTGQECQDEISRLEGNIPRIRRSMHDSLSSRCAVGFAITPDQGHTRMSSRPTKWGTIPSTDTTLQFAVRNGNDVIVFIDSLRAGGKNSLFTKILVGARIN